MDKPQNEKRSLRELWNEYWLYIVALATSGVCLYLLHHYSDNYPWHGAFEAGFIAGVLTLTVDPFVKKRLATEINKDIFYHVIGFRLPEPMQDKLRKYLNGLRYYREWLSIKVTATDIVNDDVTIEVELKGRSLMLTRTAYFQSLLFEEAEREVVEEMWARRPGSDKNLVDLKDAPTRTIPSEHMTHLYKGPEVKLEKGDIVDTYIKFTLKGRKTDYWVHTFGTTTLKTDVTLVPLNGMEMYVSQPERATPISANEFDYNEVFIIGEDLHIRWKIT